MNKGEEGYVWLLTLQLFFSGEYEVEGARILLYDLIYVKLYMYVCIHRKMYEMKITS